MSDVISSQPVRTINNGDVVVKVVDGTTVSQALAIDASGRVTAKLDDGNGNIITSQANGAQQALDVGINVAGVQIDPRSIRALTSADVVTVDQGTTPWVTSDLADGSPTGGTAGTKSALAGGIFNTAAPTLTNGQQASLQLDTSGNLKVDLTTALPAGTNIIGKVELDDGTGNSIGSTSGALNVSLTTAIPAGANNIGSVNQGTSPWITSDQADGAVSGGTAGTKSMLGGAIFNSSPLTLTTGQQAGLQSDVNGYLKVDLATALPAGANIIGAVNLDIAGSPVSATNPVPVTISAGVSGTIVNNYNTAAAVAAGASSNHTYTITTAKSFQGKKITASSAGSMRVDVQTSPDGTTFTTIFTGFTTASNLNLQIDMDEVLFLQSVSAGAAIRVVRTNLELLSAENVYSTITGVEV